MFIRHAEKPGGSFPGDGTTVDGTTDDKSLVIRGWQRAGAWAALFGSDLCSGDYPRPNIIYAAKPEPVTKKAKFSHRPFETATPLAERLQLTLRADYGVSQEHELVDEIRKLTGVVIVFWEHKAIVMELIPALKGGQIIPGVPTKWDGDASMWCCGQIGPFPTHPGPSANSLRLSMWGQRRPILQAWGEQPAHCGAVRDSFGVIWLVS